MKNIKLSAIRYIEIASALVNSFSIFFNWIKITINGNIHTILLSSDFDLNLKILKGWQLPGCYINIFLNIIFIFLIIKYNKLAVLFSIAICINCLGYLFGWFIKKSELLPYDIIKEYASANINSSPMAGLYISLICSVICILLTIFLKNKK